MKNTYKFLIRPLDLHGKKYSEVTILLENYVFISHQQNYFPIKIITGNSDKMKEIVIDFLKFNKFKFQIGDSFNKGYIIVIK